MTTDPLDAFLSKLAAADPADAEKLFDAYEPYLRMVVRRRLSPKLRTKFDSADVVQSVWLHLLRRSRGPEFRFENVDHLRAFLLRLTNNRLIDRMRRHRKSVEREQAFAGGESATIGDDRPGPDADAAAGDLWRRMLLLCPPAHRELLRLKREGLSTAEVAARVGLNEGSVRRILAELASRLTK